MSNPDSEVKVNKNNTTDAVGKKEEKVTSECCFGLSKTMVFAFLIVLAIASGAGFFIGKGQGNKVSIPEVRNVVS